MKIFNFRFLTDLQVLGCPEHYLPIFTKIRNTNFVSVKTKIDGQNHMKFYI